MANEGEGEILELVGNTKLVNSQVINAHKILELIGSKVTSSKGYWVIDSETLRIINEQIQELSSLGEAEAAKLLSEFVETQLLTGNLPSGVVFDEAFEMWKDEKINSAVNKIANEWGADVSALKTCLREFKKTKKIDSLYLEMVLTGAKQEMATVKMIPILYRTELQKALEVWLLEMVE